MSLFSLPTASPTGLFTRSWARLLRRKSNVTGDALARSLGVILSAVRGHDRVPAWQGKAIAAYARCSRQLHMCGAKRLLAINPLAATARIERSLAKMLQVSCMCIVQCVCVWV
jgi:hypothetical protein